MTVERLPPEDGTRDEVDDLFAAARTLAERPAGDERVDWVAVRARVRRRRAARTAAWAASAALVAAAGAWLALGPRQDLATPSAPAVPSTAAAPSASGAPEYRLLLPDPRIRIVADPTAELGAVSAARVELRAGTLRVAVDASAGPVPFAVQTPSTRVEVLGTRFGVRHDAGGTSVAVLEGRVRVLGIAGERVLDAGAEWSAGDLAEPLGESWRADLLRALGAPRPDVPQECRLAAAVPVPPPPGPSPPAPAEPSAPSETAPASPGASGGGAPAADHPDPLPQPSAEDLYREAEAAMAAGRLDEAVGVLERVAVMERGRPLGGTALMDLGARYRRLGRAADARAAYRRYLEEQPRGSFRGEARISLCRLEREAGDLAGARACYAAYLEEQPAGPYVEEARAGAREETEGTP